MPFTRELLIKAILSLLALAAVVFRNRVGRRLPEGEAGQLLSTLAVAAVLAYYNFGSFHGPNNLHYGELFHYVLGSKYFPELGYDGLYAASLAAQRETAPALPVPPYTRDLRNNVIVPTAALTAQQDEVERRFTPRRWRAFCADHEFFLQPSVAGVLSDLRLDHGYNPTPAWTFVGRLFDAYLPVNGVTLTLLAFLDPLLLVVVFTVVRRTFGSRAASVLVLLFGLGYAWRFTWVGGAYLRQDWLAAVVVGVCLVKRERMAAAGALFAYATAVRLFPAFLLFGLAAVCCRNLVRGESSRWAWRFAAGFVIALALSGAAGALTGRGPAAWREFKSDITKLHGTWTTNTAGLELVFIYGPSTMTGREPANWPLADRWAMWQSAMNRAQSARRPFYLAAAGLLLALVAAAAWRAPREEAIVLGVTAVFALLVLSCYYWVVLAIVALRRGLVAPLGLLGLNAMLCLTDLLQAPTEITYALMSWGVLAILLAWLLPDALATLRGRGRAEPSPATRRGHAHHPPRRAAGRPVSPLPAGS